MVVGGQRYAPAALPPGNRPGSPWQEAGWAPGSFWMGTEPSSPKFDPRTVQPVQSLCTACANPAGT